jgi:hypothetical protein
MDEFLVKSGGLTEEDRNLALGAVRAQWDWLGGIGSKVEIECETFEQAQRINDVLSPSSAAQPVRSTFPYVIGSQTQWNKTYTLEVDNVTLKAVSCTCPNYEHSVETNPSHVCKHMRAYNAVH